MGLNLADLEAVAMRAMHGKWIVEAEPDRHGFYTNVVVGDSRDTIATCGFYPKSRENARSLALANKNAKYIATFNPEVVLEMIHRLRELEEHHGNG